MFGLFKKKPLEVKYGRKSYLQNPSEFNETDDNWILMLSSVFVEAMDMDGWINESIHDKLTMYKSLSDEDRDILDGDLNLESVGEIKEYMGYVADIEPRGYESDLYNIINSNSLKEVLAKAHEHHEDDSEREDLYKWIWKHKEKYEIMHYRTGFIAYVMWQIRLATLLNVIHEDVAWSHLRTLANFMRPLMTLFSSWEEYNQNILYFHEIYTKDELLTPSKHYPRAIACLNLREESPLQKIAFDFGVKKSYKYNLTEHSYKYVKRIDSSDDEREIILMHGLLEKEDKNELWKLLDNFNEEDRNRYLTHLHISDEEKEILSEEDYLELPELYPTVSYAYYLRGEYFYYLAWEARGSGVSSTVGEENYALFYERLEYAVSDFMKAHELAPKEQTYWAELYDLLAHFHNEESETLRQKFYDLIKEYAMQNYYCVNRVSRWKQARWGGSHEENLDWAREVIAKSEYGDPVRRIIFNILIERYDYISSFDENEKKANAVFKDKKLQTEVNQYFDELLEKIDANTYGMTSSLIFWYVKAGDWERVRALAHTMKEGVFDLDFMNDEYEEEYTELYMNWIRSV